MKIRMAHISIQGRSVAVFDADAKSKTNSARNELLGTLTHQARLNGLRVDAAALAYTEHGRTVYQGSTNLVRYLAKNGVRRWTHTLTV